jgi:hypothetical protein
MCVCDQCVWVCGCACIRYDEEGEEDTVCAISWIQWEKRKERKGKSSKRVFPLYNFHSTFPLAFNWVKGGVG